MPGSLFRTGRKGGTATEEVIEMPEIIFREELPYRGNSYELEGYLHGKAGASVIFFEGPPGSRPLLHRHPYAEVFIVQEGQATFIVGDASLEVTGGQIVVAPAGVPHKFTNTGTGSLRQIDIHASDRFVTVWQRRQNVLVQP